MRTSISDGGVGVTETPGSTVTSMRYGKPLFGCTPVSFVKYSAVTPVPASAPQAQRAMLSLEVETMIQYRVPAARGMSGTGKSYTAGELVREVSLRVPRTAICDNGAGGLPVVLE